MHGLINDIGITIIIGAVVVVFITKLKQPLILGYLLTGVILGPEIGPPLVHDPKNIEIISEIGLVLLLFIIGLEMNPGQIVASGKKILVPGLLQFPVVAVTGYLFFNYIQSGSKGGLAPLYTGIFCSLSSTAIVVKLLYDKLEMDSMYGRVSIGILIFQDIWAILVLALQPNFTDPDIILVAVAIMKSIGLLLTGFIFSKYILQTVFHWIYKNPEMVVLVSIGWCALLAAAGDIIGLSMEMGALIAGISISTFPYSIHVTGRVSILRDFFLSMFFVSLGMKIPFPELNIFIEAIALVGFLLVSRFISVYPLMVYSGSSRRNAFLASITLAQISEFSLVIATIGIGLGHIGKESLAVVLYAMSITAIISSYIIKYNRELYRFFKKAIEFGNQEILVQARQETGNFPVIVLGCHLGAREMLELISGLNPGMTNKILVIDYNIESLKELQILNVATLFGDVSSIDTLRHAHLERAKIILSTIPDILLKGVTNEHLVRVCKSMAPEALIVATAETGTQAEKLRKAGARKVILPYAMIGDELADFILLESKNL